jgi:hypothetical protein
MCVGGMVVARTMVDRALADELRDACIVMAHKLGGWNKEIKSRTGKSRRPQLLSAVPE